eukprot:GHVU01053314.1.p1 GENE.GHVU01053314.1~~GHVU01053314.1.p1  ORF type:complete len:205 (-),score=21.42 GHVU01053314.1:166-780(-)
MLPAVAQGAIAMQCRTDDSTVRRILNAVHDEDTWRAVSCERAFLAGLDGDCRSPIAAHAVTVESSAGVGRGEMWLRGLVASPDGVTVERIEARGSSATSRQSETLGTEVGERASEGGSLGSGWQVGSVWRGHVYSSSSVLHRPVDLARLLCMCAYVLRSRHGLVGGWGAGPGCRSAPRETFLAPPDGGHGLPFSATRKFEVFAA